MRTTQPIPGTLWALVFAALASTVAGAQVSRGHGGAQEGIKVRGQWAIEVTAPDGTLVKRVEFENALVYDGQVLLSMYLGRARTPGRWAILVFDGLCAPDAGASTVCVVVEPDSLSGGTPYSGPNVWPNLALVQPTPAAPVVTLRGTFTAAAAGTVSAVATAVGACGQAFAPQNCSEVGLGGANAFSSRTLPTPIQVQAGQIVQVSVTFSFH